MYSLFLENKIFRNAIIPLSVIALFLMATQAFEVSNILTFLSNAGVKVPPGLSEALSTIGTVYGIQQYIIALLGVTVPAVLIGSALAAGAFGL
ncbi:hypothetical protein [Bacillus subtilis]|uniref:hypothetical protein n=1 Tax=Bacillus subtilis TaxID=1423 RepID=UPI00022BBCBE|nr:hypothetical protein [Bacillus subtilis]AEP90297.1 conserved hypothetical protein [Bacillus subtilis subsp. subtilis str. RO-NN-1]MED2947746.1 hypothetical protein [Bacillus subtilis]QFY84202.1 hypothetical protein D0819_01730 [Bacillus subtilis]RXF79839.1 hypothetical protein B2G85_06155 [Bacillus subtilis]UVZ59155.1 hypothetical protein NYR91_06390 [Bacillus subtilis]